jgi:hypothetical protein
MFAIRQVVFFCHLSRVTLSRCLFFVVFLRSQLSIIFRQPRRTDRKHNRQIIANQVTIVHKHACKLVVYVRYLIGNNIGKNDQENSHEDAF